MNITLTVEELKKFASDLAGWHHRLDGEIFKAVTQAMDPSRPWDTPGTTLIRAAKRAQEQFIQNNPEPTVARLLNL